MLSRYCVRSMSVSSIRKCQNLANKMTAKYEGMYKKIYNQFSAVPISEKTIFANVELSLKDITVYGFDFDYTLVQYKEAVLRLIYNLAKQKMIQELSYPEEIMQLKYDRTFAIRGLHLDIKTGLLMKMDAYHHIQSGSVYRGRELVSDDEVIGLYGGKHISLDMLADDRHRSGLEISSPGTTKTKMVQFLDRFSNSEVALFADISDYFYRNNIPFDPLSLYTDVMNTIRDIHVTSQVHTIIAKAPDKYIRDSLSTIKYLEYLKNKKKKLFILTNSPFWFVDKGMRHVTKSDNWIDLFDVVVCSAHKPSFYTDLERPFRLLVGDNHTTPSWERVTSFVPGSVYAQGNIKELVYLTGCKGSKVLYFGDHVYSDLTDPNLQLGWDTVAIIPELNREIQNACSEKYRKSLAELLVIENLLNEVQEEMQTIDTQELPIIQELIKKWVTKRKYLQKELKMSCSPYFGSVFRTERGPTYFSRRLTRFASLYTSSINNFLSYSTEHTFYARRFSLPHEVDVYFDS